MNLKEITRDKSNKSMLSFFNSNIFRFCRELFFIIMRNQRSDFLFPLQFLTYQKEHWNQQLGWFFNTAAYQTEELVLCSVNDLPQALGLWLPNLIALLGGLVLVLPALRFTPKTAEELLQEEETPAQEAIRAASPLRASYGLYYLVYYFFSMGATWLLSAPRYLACAVPLSLALALVTKKRWVNGLMTILLLVLQVLYLAAYVQGWHVY